MNDTTHEAPDWENFAKAVLTDWPTGDLDGSVLFDLSLQYGMIKEVPGGYNSDHHIDADGICPEEGDPWYEYTFRGEAGPGLYSITDMTRRIEELEAENHLLKTSGIVEVAVRNPRVMEYMQHWEGRAETAEAKLAQQDDLVQAAVAAKLREAAECCTAQLWNTAMLMSNPPQSSAAWDARNAILALIPEDAQAALDRVVAAEQERCARVADQMAETDANMNRVWRQGCEDVAAAIRKGGD
jgi:hypothetical protein